MKTLTEIRLEINELLNEAENIISQSKEQAGKIIALSMLMSLKTTVRDQFKNIKQWTN